MPAQGGPVAVSAKREARVRKILHATARLFLSPSEKGNYLKLCVDWGNKRNRKQGTFARLPMGSTLSDQEMRAIVRMSVLEGRVLEEAEVAPMLLAMALTDRTPKIPLEEHTWGASWQGARQAGKSHVAKALAKLRR
jgi:hypothetical protein